MINAADVRNFVIQKIGRECFLKLVDFAKESHVKLMGEQVSLQRIPTVVALSLYRDLTGQGYQRILSQVRLSWIYSDLSFRTNTKRLRAALHKWARKQIKRGTWGEWDQAAKDCRLPKRLRDITLWIDAVDFPVERGPGRSQFWSHKLGRPGLQYMVIRDGKRKIRGLYGGHSPKTYEGTWLRSHKELMEEQWAGGVFVGDEHFHKANTYFSDPVFHTTVRAIPSQEVSSQKNQSVSSSERAALTRKQELHNSEISDARARIESVCGQLSHTFQCLTKPWAEEFEQLDYVVNIAAAVANYKGH